MSFIKQCFREISKGQHHRKKSDGGVACRGSSFSVSNLATMTRPLPVIPPSPLAGRAAPRSKLLINNRFLHVKTAPPGGLHNKPPPTTQLRRHLSSLFPAATPCSRPSLQRRSRSIKQTKKTRRRFGRPLGGWSREEAPPRSAA